MTFRDLASAAVYCEKKGYPFTWITQRNGGYLVKRPAKKKLRDWLEKTAVSRLHLIGFLRIGDSSTFVQKVTGRKAFLKPIKGKPGRVTMDVETIAQLNRRTPATKRRK